MKTHNTTSIRNTLTSLQTENPDSLLAIVASDALDECSPLSYLEDVTQHGCISGTVSRLVYYVDTNAFFDTHYDEIQEMIEEYQESTGIDLVHTGDLKNFYSWFAYEQIAYEILNQLTDGA